jgi:hypothetical protein
MKAAPGVDRHGNHSASIDNSRRRSLRFTQLVPLVLIVICAIVGGLQGNRSSGRNFPHDPGIVAWVGSKAISQAELDSAMTDVRADLQPSATSYVRVEVLGKLIDEELIFQYGIRQRIFERDPFLKLAIVRAMLTFSCGGTFRPNGPPIEASEYADCAERGGLGAERTVDAYVDWLRQRAIILRSSRL